MLRPRENLRHVGAFSDIGDDRLAAHQQSRFTRFLLFDIHAEQPRAGPGQRRRRCRAYAPAPRAQQYDAWPSSRAIFR